MPRLPHLLFAITVAGAFSLHAQNVAAPGNLAEVQTPPPADSLLFGTPAEREVTDDLLALGRLITMGGAEAGGAGMACMACHGVDGMGGGPGTIPRLAGQSAAYLDQQLIDYAQGARPNRIMGDIAQSLSHYERAAVSAYYAFLDAPYPDMPDDDDIDTQTLQWGAQLAAVGAPDRGITSCVSCHGAAGMGMPPVPYLAGQSADYMTHQLDLWAEGARNNDALDVMSTIAEAMTPEERRAVSEYFARVRPGQTGVVGIDIDLTLAPD